MFEAMNMLYTAGITANGGNPRYLENWYFAAWTYNTCAASASGRRRRAGCAHDRGADRDFPVEFVDRSGDHPRP
ncbi:hypothetical protein [Actinokineospora inagensis]|uniref:hypothetical protein n=1 Tax=Actinokineospora inagensis TaxID=103730 RepID=UPI00047D8329|nr:hypothetical protein [Actinokineospora inagensis]